MIEKKDTPSLEARDWISSFGGDGGDCRSGKPLPVLLAVALLAAVFCLLLCGCAHGDEGAEEGLAAERASSEDVRPHVDPAAAVSADLSPASEDPVSRDVPSSDSFFVEISADEVLSPDSPLTVVVSGDRGAASADYAAEDLSSGDAFLREMLSPVPLSSRDLSADAVGTVPLSVDVISPDGLSGPPVSGDDFPLSPHAGGRVRSADTGGGEEVLPADEKRSPGAGEEKKVSPSERFGVMTGNLVNFRSEPTLSSEVLAKLGKGERVRILKEWVPPSEGEAVLTRSCEIDIGKETIRLPNGFGVRVTAVHPAGDTVDVSFRHGDRWVSGTLAGDAVSSTVGDPWFLVQREDGRLGWAYGKYVETAPRRREGPGPEVQSLYREGVELLEAGKSGEALFRLDQVLELYPGHVDALFARGRCLAAMKRYEEAVESFWEIPFYAPAQPLYLPWTGYCWQAAGRYDRALLAYGAALRLHPDHEIARAVSDHVMQCREALGLPPEALPSDEQIRTFLFDRWDDHIAEDIWNGSLRGKGLWETW